MQTEVLEDEEKEKDATDTGATNTQNTTTNTSNTQNTTTQTQLEPVAETSTNNQPLTSTKVDVDAVKDHLQEIENQFASQYPVFDESIYDGLDYQRVEMPTAESIAQMAQEDLSDYRQTHVENINTDYMADVNSLNNQESEVQNELSTTQDELATERDYGLARQQSENISQGIERSSIASNRANTFNATIDRELETALNQANNELAEISLKREIAESEFRQALENFDITYANKLENRISELTKEYSNKQSEALEYNERIQKQREQVYNEWKRWADTYTSQLDSQKGMQKAYYVIDQIKGLSRRDAMEFLKDTDIVKALGIWYNAVLDYVERVL